MRMMHNLFRWNIADREIKAMRDERMKLQQQEAVRQQMLQATEGIKSIAQADKAATGDTSLLAQIMGGQI